MPRPGLCPKPRRCSSRTRCLWPMRSARWQMCHRDWQTNYQKTKGLLPWQQLQSGVLLRRSFVDFGGSRAMEP